MNVGSLIVEYAPWRTALVGIALLILIPKKVYAFVLFGVFIVFGVFVYYFVDKAESERNATAVTVSVAHDAKKCREEMPLLVVVRNASAKAVSKVSWNIAAHIPGDTTNLVWYGRTGKEWDRPYFTGRVLGQGESASYCHKVPTLKTSMFPHYLEYEAVFKSVEFAR
jgi:hypothetical protein